MVAVFVVKIFRSPFNSLLVPLKENKPVSNMTMSQFYLWVYFIFKRVFVVVVVVFGLY